VRYGQADIDSELGELYESSIRGACGTPARRLRVGCESQSRESKVEGRGVCCAERISGPSHDSGGTRSYLSSTGGAVGPPRDKRA